jgi:uncharacterized protein (TIGR02118 family)
MIKYTVCIKKHPTLSRAKFQKYWLEHHGPLFQKFAKTYRAVRYVQSHTFDTPLITNIRQSRGFPEEDYDGLAEIWWNSEEDFLAAAKTPECQALRSMFIEDEGRFIDFSKSVAFFSIEHVLVDGKV